MDNKPIVTCHGDQSLFAKLKDLVVRGLPRETVEWKRSYGRPCRSIRVDVNFVPYNPNILPADDEWTLLGRPFFHTFWTDCDADTYKASVREEITDWLSVLKDKNSPDWLIIVVVNDENRVRSKLLRNTVYDKVKNDFCSKLSDRCVMLIEPLKSDAKSSESWSHALQRMRQHLLDSYNRNLDRFEEHMRAQRERRIEPRWSFCTYFLLQEELAFMYEMLRLFEDALVQYDELDALFTQFVVNHAAGDRADWLVEFSQHPTTRWDGLCLSQPINFAKRSMIKRNLASLLDFRNYLFSRQCTLLMLLERPWEMGTNSVPFMHNCIRELKILQITLPEGAIDCWVFLNCLELLKTLDATLGDAEAFRLHKATLRDYARSKISQLGSLCGLMPDTEPTSNQSQLVEELLPGLVRTEGDYEAMNKLKEALSSKKAFYKYYVELSESAMAEFKLKHVGRTRAARRIGQDLANFYIALGEPEKAEGFLRDSLNLYKSDGWEMLANHTRMNLAECQRLTGKTHKYCRTCMHIAASLTLDVEQRRLYQHHLINVATEESALLVKCKPVFYISNIRLSTNTFFIGRPALLYVTLTVNLVDLIHVDYVGMSVATLSSGCGRNASDVASVGSILQRQSSWSSGQSLRSRHTSGASVLGIDLYNRIRETIETTSQHLDLHELIEYRTDPHHGQTITTSALICRSPLKILGAPPHGKAKEKDIVKDNSDLSLGTTDVELKAGENEVAIPVKIDSVGSYVLSQMCIRLGSIEFLQSLAAEAISFSVINFEPAISISCTETLISGMLQTLELVIHTTVDSSAPGLTRCYAILSTDNLRLQPSCADDRLQVEEDGKQLLLTSSADVEEIRVSLGAFAIIKDTESSAACYKVTVSCDGWEQPATQDIPFMNPCRISHALYSSYKRKYIQIVVVGTTGVTLMLTDAKLRSDSTQATMTLFNNPSEALLVSKNQSASFLWELTNIEQNAPPLKCTFSVHYRPKQEYTSETSYDYTHKFTLCNYTTLYVVSTRLLPPENDTKLMTGHWYPVSMTIRLVDSVKWRPLRYEVLTDKKIWILEGCHSGIVAFKDDHSFEVSLRASPLVKGFLHLPSVRLLHQAHSEEKECNEEETKEFSETDGNIKLTRLHTVYTKPPNTSEEMLTNASTSFVTEPFDNLNDLSTGRGVDNVVGGSVVNEVAESNLLYDNILFEAVDAGQIYNASQAQQVWVCLGEEKTVASNQVITDVKRMPIII